MRMITLRDIADDNTSISSTRWAFASVIKFDIVVISISIATYLVGHFIGKPIDGSFFGYVATLLGTLTGIVTTSKALQGFETKENDKSSNEDSKDEECEFEQTHRPAHRHDDRETPKERWM